MSKPILTEAVCRAAGTDAGNRAMRRGGRTAWNEDDHAAACAECNRLLHRLDPERYPLDEAEPEPPPERQAQLALH